MEPNKEQEIPLINQTDTPGGEDGDSRISVGRKSYSVTRPNQNSEAEINMLISMGYQDELVRKIYLFLKPQTLNQAIDYMTMSNEQYQHNFYKSTSFNRSLCFLCGKPKKNHMDYNEAEDNKKEQEEDKFDLVDYLKNIKNTASNVINYLIDAQDVKIVPKDNVIQKVKEMDEPKPIVQPANVIKLIDETVSCSICMSNVKKEAMNPYTLPCDHECCKQCFYEYIKKEIESAKVAEIHCFGLKCNNIISEKIILSVIKGNQILMDKYKRFKLRAEILASSTKKFCPEPNCESYIERNIGGDKYVQCKVGHKYCYVCLKPWHGKTPCDEELDKDFQIWKTGKVIKQCPQCKFYTEKNEGCNHMTCAECKFQWCWLCEKEYKPGHFDKGRGTCGGQQFSKKNYPELPKPLPNYDFSSKNRFVDNPTSKQNRMDQIKLIINAEHTEADACCESFVNSDFLCRPPFKCCRNIYATFVYFFCFFSFALKISYILSFIDITVVNHRVEYSVWSASMGPGTRAIVNIICVFMRLILLFPYMIPGFAFAVLRFFLNLGKDSRPYNCLFVMCDKINAEKRKVNNAQRSLL